MNRYVVIMMWSCLGVCGVSDVSYAQRACDEPSERVRWMEAARVHEAEQRYDEAIALLDALAQRCELSDEERRVVEERLAKVRTAKAAGQEDREAARRRQFIERRGHFTMSPLFLVSSGQVGGEAHGGVGLDVFLGYRGEYGHVGVDVGRAFGQRALTHVLARAGAEYTFSSLYYLSVLLGVERGPAWASGRQVEVGYGVYTGVRWLPFEREPRVGFALQVGARSYHGD